MVLDCVAGARRRLERFDGVFRRAAAEHDVEEAARAFEVALDARVVSVFQKRRCLARPHGLLGGGRGHAARYV